MVSNTVTLTGCRTWLSSANSFLNNYLIFCLLQQKKTTHHRKQTCSQWRICCGVRKENIRLIISEGNASMSGRSVAWLANNFGHQGGLFPLQHVPAQLFCFTFLTKHRATRAAKGWPKRSQYWCYLVPKPVTVSPSRNASIRKHWALATIASGINLVILKRFVDVHCNLFHDPNLTPNYYS